MSSIETIRDFTGKVIGKIETDSNGNKLVRDFYGKVLGRYDKTYDVTRDFSGRVIARGDVAAALINSADK